MITKMLESCDGLNEAVSICSGSIASDNRPISEQGREAADVHSDLLGTSNDSENGEKTDQMKDVLHGEHETQVSEADWLMMA
ncbi:hypothetical protein Btru_047706 [Bulinus truncatus]|nr:hypothetical protein Btru_047706 [Bulinus truncatus]